MAPEAVGNGQSLGSGVGSGSEGKDGIGVVLVD